MIREIIIGFVAILTLIGLNVAWQHINCGTPLARCDAVQIVPCESGEKLAAEMEELQQRARDNPAR